MATSNQNGRKNYGYEKDNRAQDGTHCPQDRTEGGACYAQDRTEGGARYPQDGAKVYIVNYIADYAAGSPPKKLMNGCVGRNNWQASANRVICPMMTSPHWGTWLRDGLKKRSSPP